ncbi:hypothetical protein SAMN04488057_10121 [Cyclobacterium lianum]|uniref:Uncharacterized protein n=2 Tax=Cyclobacterium lianum TaxID=388280 RepID=A0A1M7HR23_9BACT|nr:hypothetical protein SAMN04488057_10121 [Cyclobacterium lianum]
MRISVMRPQDVVVILKLILEQDTSWTQTSLSRDLHLSQSEISESIARSSYARLVFDKGRMVQRQALIDFIQYGLPYVFPQQPGMVQRGFPTAHSALPLSEEIVSEEKYVWPSAKGTARGHSILPLYPSVVQVIQSDASLYELLALVDAVRVGRARERNLAMDMIKSRLL